MIDLVLACHDAALDGRADLPWQAATRVHAQRADAGVSVCHLQYLLALAAGIARGEHPDLDPAGWTVFASADALRSPASLPPPFADPLRWADVQPLPLWGAADGLARPHEHFCPVTLAPLGRLDPEAAPLAEQYRRRHGLTAGGNLLTHFLGLAGLPGLAAQAAAADLGVAAPGGVVAVRNARLLALLDPGSQALVRLDALLRSEPLYRPMLERCWLHLFALPFVQLPPLPPLALPADGPVEAPREVPPAMARVVASIDALLARSAPPPPLRRSRPSRPSAAVGQTGLRLSAIDELRPAAPPRGGAASPGATAAGWPDLSQVGRIHAQLQAHSLG